MLDRRTFLQHFAGLAAVFSINPLWLAGYQGPEKAQDSVKSGQIPRLITPEWTNESPVYRSNGMDFAPQPCEWKYPLSVGQWHFGMFTSPYPEGQEILGTLLAYGSMEFRLSNYDTETLQLNEKMNTIAIESGTAIFFRVAQIEPEKRWFQGKIGRNVGHGASFLMLNPDIVQDSNIQIDAFTVVAKGSGCR